MYITIASEKGVEGRNQSSEHCLAFWLTNDCFLWAQSEMGTKQIAQDDDKRIDSWTHLGNRKGALVFETLSEEKTL